MNRISLAIAMAAAVLAVSPAAAFAVPLPEGRAYERVSPADKNGGDVGGPVLAGGFASALGQSAVDGDAIVYASLASFADAKSADLFTYYISKRDGTGWSTHAISPPPADPPRFLELPPFRVFAPDLSVSVLEWGEPALAPEAPPKYKNLYLRPADGSYLLLTRDAPLNRLPGSYQVTFAGATADMSHIVFEANDALLPEAPGEVSSVYEWSAVSGLRLVSVLPEGEPAPEASAGGVSENDYAAVISADGSRVFWTAAEQLYVREDGTRTVKLNASRREASLGDGTATLMAISRDGSKAFFSDPTSLTDAPNDHGGLYEYDLEAEDLRLLTPDPAGAPVIQGMIGVGAAGSPAYFVSPAVLVAGAEEGKPNLYLERAGTLELIATLSNRDLQNWTRNLEERTSRLTPDGEHLAFLSQASLTGYDNNDAATGEPDSELFVYSAAEDKLTCVSCNPTEALPIGGTTLPRGTPSNYLPHVFSADGSRIFFNSTDALVPGDSNRRQDVYVFADGKPQLISTGTSSDLSALADVAAGGRDVFFTTRSRLVGSDRDNSSDLYDARVGGGFPEAPEPLPCAGEACRSLIADPPPPPFPATSQPVPESRRKKARHHRGRCRHRKERSGTGVATAKRCQKGR